MNRIQKAKQHVKEHKAVYITGGVCLVVGAVAGGGYVFTRPEVLQNVKMQNLGFTWKPTQTVIQFVERSTPSKPVHLVGTQKYWDSIHAAARDTGHSVSDISKCINGLRNNVKGDVFTAVKTAV